MGPLIGLLCFIGAGIAWMYFAFQPEYANKRALSVFNWSVMGAGAMICLAWVLNMKMVLKGDDYAKFKTAFEVIGVLGIECGWLVLMFLIRNFWIFKPPRRPGGW
ncbi:MAG: hypothetical protein ACAH83_04970 [Alphaproteobacteria bacterium]